MHLLSSLRVNCRSHSFHPLKHSPFKFTFRTFRKKGHREDGGMNLAPKITAPEHQHERIFPVLFKCFTFTTGFCGTVFIGASIWNYENNKALINHHALSDWVKTKWNKMEGFEHKQGEFRKSLNRWWNEESDGRKIFWAICALNALVFTCWRLPALQGTMMKYFCSSPVGRAICWPMVLSTFSHYAPLHLIMNMYVLHSFSYSVGSSLGKEQFVAFYLAGGVVSSFLSHFFKLMTQSIGPSLGASGAIMALLGYFCTRYPDAKLGIVFLPNYPFSAEAALKGIMLLDLSGIVFRWKLFDHAAHLGGAVFGVLYAMYGQSLVWENRSSVTKVWSDFSRKYLDKRKED